MYNNPGSHKISRKILTNVNIIMTNKKNQYYSHHLLSIKMYSVVFIIVDLQRLLSRYILLFMVHTFIYLFYKNKNFILQRKYVGTRYLYNKNRDTFIVCSVPGVCMYSQINSIFWLSPVIGYSYIAIPEATLFCPLVHWLQRFAGQFIRETKTFLTNRFVPDIPQ